MPPPRDEAVALFLQIIHFALFNLHNSKQIITFAPSIQQTVLWKIPLS